MRNCTNSAHCYARIASPMSGRQVWRAQTQQAKSLGRHVVTIPSLRSNRPSGQLDPLVKGTLWSKEPSGQKTSGQWNLWSKGPSGQRDPLVNGTSGQRYPLVKKSLVNGTLVKIPLVNETLVKGSTPSSRTALHCLAQHCVKMKM